MGSLTAMFIHFTSPSIVVPHSRSVQLHKQLQQCLGKGSRVLLKCCAIQEAYNSMFLNGFLGLEVHHVDQLYPRLLCLHPYDMEKQKCPELAPGMTVLLQNIAKLQTMRRCCVFMVARSAENAMAE